MNKNLFFRSGQNADAIMTGVGALAIRLGLTNHMGRGDITGLLELLASGDVVVLHIGNAERLDGIIDDFGFANLDELLGEISNGQVVVWHHAGSDDLHYILGHAEANISYDGDVFDSLAAALRDAAQRMDEA